jgi:hypothetical protein
VVVFIILKTAVRPRKSQKARKYSKEYKTGFSFPGGRGVGRAVRAKGKHEAG